jgi:N6-adenosine-specific RNA methylase IME4
VTPWRTILMDPPWPEHGGGKVKRGADRHYPLVSCHNMFPTIRLAEVWTPADDAHLYMWVTNNYLPQGLQLMASLDFRYVTNLVWVKDRSGLGQYFRGQHELCLFGVRGQGYSVRTLVRDMSTVIGAPRKSHSAKPPEFHDLVEERSEGPYLEMFARAPRVGWTTWGNELEGEHDRTNAAE